MVATDESDPSLEIKKDKSSAHKEQQDSTVIANIVAEEATAGKSNLECIISSEVCKDCYEFPHMSCGLYLILNGRKRAIT